MKFINDTTWEDVFAGWRDREATNPGWIRCANEKGWPDWESWRRFTASQIGADKREWKIFEFAEPVEEIPKMLLGPYSGWQSRVSKKNSSSFEDLLDIPEQLEFFGKHEGVLSMLNGLPFTTEFIGLVREDSDKVVCIEGHHRATAIALAKRQGKQIDWSGAKITIALARIPAAGCLLFDEVAKRGMSKNPKA